MSNDNILFKTDRLYLREFVIEDAAHLLELNADPEVVKFTGDPPFKDLAHATKFILDYDQYKKFGMGRWVVKLLRDDTFIGWCGLKQHPNSEVDLGFRLLRAHWGNGYATEAADGCLNHGFQQLGLSEIIARVMHQNLASIRVIQKLGMTYVEEIICEKHPAKKYHITNIQYNR